MCNVKGEILSHTIYSGFIPIRYPKGDPLVSEKQNHTLLKDEQIFNFCASSPLKPIQIFEKLVIQEYV